MLIAIKKKQANWTSLPTEKKDNVSHIKKKNYSSGLLDSGLKNIHDIHKDFRSTP